MMAVSRLDGTMWIVLVTNCNLDRHSSPGGVGRNFIHLVQTDGRILPRGDRNSL